jgi:hypothetical protein
MKDELEEEQVKDEGEEEKLERALAPKSTRQSRGKKATKKYVSVPAYPQHIPILQKYGAIAHGVA